MIFEKSPELFPIKKNYCYLANCSVAGAYLPGLHAAHETNIALAETAVASLAPYAETQAYFRKTFATLLNVSAESISYCSSTAEGFNIIAQSYPFDVGDEVITYAHEYPSNFYPWKVLERRGVVVKLIPSTTVNTQKVHSPAPISWSIADLERLITPRTKVIALSHVQFGSGFACDLHAIGALCKLHNIDFIVDAAQSLGAIPIHPSECNIAALAASGWKWLLGPVGSAVLYSSDTFRKKLIPTVMSINSMQHSSYLEREIHPHRDGRFFEYSTQGISLARGLAESTAAIALRYTPLTIFAELQRLQDLFLEHLHSTKATPLLFSGSHRSGILALSIEGELPLVLSALKAKGVILTAPGGYLRIAPHIFNDDDEMVHAAELLNEVLL